jgi:lambda repressor-like predicted transcriptional regulator
MKKRTKLVTGAVLALLALVIVPMAVFAQQGPKPRPNHEHALMRALTETAAQTLGMTPQEFVQAMRQGKTPAQLAEEAQVNPDDLAAAMQNTWNTQGEQLIATFIEQGAPAKVGQREAERRQRALRRWTRLAAETLDMSPRVFVQELRSGQSAAQIAEAHGSSGQALVDAVVAAEQAHLDQAVADGKMTQEEADNLLPKIIEQANKWVVRVPPTNPPGN